MEMNLHKKAIYFHDSLDATTYARERMQDLLKLFKHIRDYEFSLPKMQPFDVFKNDENVVKRVKALANSIHLYQSLFSRFWTLSSTETRAEYEELAFKSRLCKDMVPYTTLLH
eukprot:COSAG01_NODE_5577_length_4171_cov_19.212426_5_plen_113_part_00